MRDAVVDVAGAQLHVGVTAEQATRPTAGRPTAFVYFEAAINNYFEIQDIDRLKDALFHLLDYHTKIFSDIQSSVIVHKEDPGRPLSQVSLRKFKTTIIERKESETFQ